MRFRKFHAAGNDFLVLAEDPRRLDEGFRRRLCERHTGVGADGLVAIEPAASSGPVPAFAFLYWNADGQPGTFCGNGARVAGWLAYETTQARRLELIAGDGTHPVHILAENPPQIEVGLRLVQAPLPAGEKQWFVHTGSPHLLWEVPPTQLKTFPLATAAPPLRWKKDWDPHGVNVSVFAALGPHQWGLRTYERGVEAETLSCGTACVALAALVAPQQPNPIEIHTPGGLLSVTFREGYYWLRGPVEETFRGEWLARS